MGKARKSNFFWDTTPFPLNTAQSGGGGRVVRYRHVCLKLPSGVGTPWPYFAQLPKGSTTTFSTIFVKKIDFMPILRQNFETFSNYAITFP